MADAGIEALSVRCSGEVADLMRTGTAACCLASVNTKVKPETPLSTLLLLLPLLPALGCCCCAGLAYAGICLSLIHISEPTRQEAISYAVFCLKKIFFFNDTATTEIYT